MRVRFQADADLDGRVLRGLKRAAPEIDIRTAEEAGLTGLEDPEVFANRRRGWASSPESGSADDAGTLPPVCGRCDQSGSDSPSRRCPHLYGSGGTGPGWSASKSNEWINRLVWIPL